MFSYILKWIELDEDEKVKELPDLKAALNDWLDVDFTGTQWEAEWLASGKVCKCKALLILF